MKKIIILIARIFPIIFAISCSTKSESTGVDFEALVDAYGDSIALFNTVADYRGRYYDFGEVIINKWAECQRHGVIHADAVATVVVAGHYLDGAVSEGVASSLLDIVARDSTQFEVLASILKLEQSEKYKQTAIELAKLFFFNALREEIYKDSGIREADKYINEVFKTYPTFKPFLNKIGMKIEAVDGIIYMDGIELGSPDTIG
ncbi:MAG: hypothetical protein HDT06_02925 [Bacteroidales bacterium]|nr:hypothetical protein [Bacteroidales bacterium]